MKAKILFQIVQKKQPKYRCELCDVTVTLLAKRKTLFDDRTQEIQELISIIKQDISALNQYECQRPNKKR